MDSAFRELQTARQIADEVGVPFHKVDYAIQRRRVTEAARVGIVRLFDADGVTARATTERACSSTPLAASWETTLPKRRPT